MKEAADQFKGLWGKKQTVGKAPVAKVARKPALSEQLLAKYSGEPSLVGAQVAWGDGMLWPVDGSLTKMVNKYLDIGADRIVGVLGAGSGGPCVSVARGTGSFVQGFDWRPETEQVAQKFVKQSEQAAKITIRTISLDTVFPPQRRCHGMVVAEPLLARHQEKTLDWLRLALEAEGQVILEEPSMEAAGESMPPDPWFAGVSNDECSWLSPGERENTIKNAGFLVKRVQETTGGALRNHRAALQQANVAEEQLRKTIEIAPILAPALEFFTKEVNAAKNRYRALESGGVAVYRYIAIKQRTER